MGVGTTPGWGRKETVHRDGSFRVSADVGGGAGQEPAPGRSGPAGSRCPGEARSRGRSQHGDWEPEAGMVSCFATVRPQAAMVRSMVSVDSCVFVSVFCSFRFRVIPCPGRVPNRSFGAKCTKHQPRRPRCQPLRLNLGLLWRGGGSLVRSSGCSGKSFFPCRSVSRSFSWVCFGHDF